MSDLLVEIKEAVEKAKAAFRTGLSHKVKQGLRLNGPPRRPEGQSIKRGRIKQSPAKNLLENSSFTRNMAGVYIRF